MWCNTIRMYILLSRLNMWTMSFLQLILSLTLVSHLMCQSPLTPLPGQYCSYYTPGFTSFSGLVELSATGAVDCSINCVQSNACAGGGGNNLCPWASSASYCTHSTCTTCNGLGTARGYCNYCPRSQSVMTCSAGCVQVESCPVGSYSAESGLLACVDCPLGNYQINNGSTFCNTCSPGTFASVAGSSACTLCSVGTFSSQPEQTAACTECSIGTYASMAGMTTCLACSSGSYANVTGASACVQCALGAYTNTAQPTACLLCPMGKFGVVLNQSVPICSSCPVGTFSGLLGATACLPCPQGSFSNTPAGASSCGLCPNGEYTVTAGSSSCSLCVNSRF